MVCDHMLNLMSERLYLELPEIRPYFTLVFTDLHFNVSIRLLAVIHAVNPSSPLVGLLRDVCKRKWEQYMYDEGSDGGIGSTLSQKRGYYVIHWKSRPFPCPIDSNNNSYFPSCLIDILIALGISYIEDLNEYYPSLVGIELNGALYRLSGRPDTNGGCHSASNAEVKHEGHRFHVMN